MKRFFTTLIAAAALLAVGCEGNTDSEGNVIDYSGDKYIGTTTLVTNINVGTVLTALGYEIPADEEFLGEFTTNDTVVYVDEDKATNTATVTLANISFTNNIPFIGSGTQTLDVVLPNIPSDDGGISYYAEDVVPQTLNGTSLSTDILKSISEVYISDSDGFMYISLSCTVYADLFGFGASAYDMTIEFTAEEKVIEPVTLSYENISMWLVVGDETFDYAPFDYDDILEETPTGSVNVSITEILNDNISGVDWQYADSDIIIEGLKLSTATLAPSITAEFLGLPAWDASANESDVLERAIETTGLDLSFTAFGFLTQLTTDDFYATYTEEGCCISFAVNYYGKWYYIYVADAEWLTEWLQQPR